MRLLERVIEATKKEVDETHSPFYYQHKLATIQSYWNKITMTHSDIIANPDETYDDYLNNKTYQSLEDNYHSIAIKLQEQLGTTQRTDDEIKLPRLMLPTFEGDYEHWTSFHDIFVRLIHNNTRLGDAEKMQYLKTHLRKEAGSLLQHLTISNANYKTAWQLLNDRFDNKRKICSTQLQILLSQPKLEQESANGIRKLHDTTRECLHALSNLGIDTSTWAPIITHIIIHKLDLESHRLYEQTLEKPRDLATNEGLFRFLETRFQSLELLKDSKKKENFTLTRQHKVVRSVDYSRYKSFHTNAKLLGCSYCQQSHRLYQCQKFLRLSTNDRRQFVQTKKLCSNCLTHKEGEKCPSRYSCNICQRHHHTLLHQGPEKRQPTTTQATVHISTAQLGETISRQRQPRQVILATALLKAKTSGGRSELLRALIDQGSQASFISEESAQILGLPRLKAAQVSGIALAKAGLVKHKVILDLSPRFPSQFSIKVEALVLPQLTRQLPDSKITDCQNLHLGNNLLLADPTFGIPGPIDIIIGADIFSSIICQGMAKYNSGLFGQQTEFGWILAGPIKSCNKNANTITSMVSYVNLDKTLKSFWEIENVETSNTQLSSTDATCEQHFVQNYTRNKDGSYTVRMPFRPNKKQLGESRRKAMARLLQKEGS